MGAEVIQTPFGKFLIPPGDLIGSTLKAGTLWDGPGFLQPIALEHGQLGTPGVTILDIGANLGQFSVWLARRGAWRVLAVEPVPTTLDYLKANLDLNADVCADRVIPIPLAGYSRQTRLYVSTVDPGNLGGTALLPVEGPPHRLVAAGPLDTLRPFCGTRVSLIKIDAQGCDGAVILGLAQTIAKDHPAIVFEWDEPLAIPHGVGLQNLLDKLRLDWGYQVTPWPSHPDNYVAVWDRDYRKATA